MYAAVQRDDGTLINIRGVEHKISSGGRTFYFAGNIDGLVRSDYTIERDVGLHDVVGNLPKYLPRLNGRYAGLSVRDGVLEFAASDIGAVEELNYTETDKELLVSTDFFELARAKGQLDYDPSEALYFIKHGFCRKGKTTFKEIYRLPPGEALQYNVNSTITTDSYLKHFLGEKVTYDAFKNALNHLVASVIALNPSFEEVVSHSGGVDSSVLLSLVKQTKDVTAVTYRFSPAIAFNVPDVTRSERIAKKLQVDHEFVEVDLDEINLAYLDDVIRSMPFAAHLSINFKKMFETLRGRKKRLWSGQNLDTLYFHNLSTHGAIHRFLLSDSYVKMLKGVKGYQRYRPAKRILDAALKRLYSYELKQRFETPGTLEELVEYFYDSESRLALRVAQRQNGGPSRSTEASESINVSEIRTRLFDETLGGGFITGQDHKIQHQAKKLFDMDIVLAYSTPSIVHLLRNLNLSALDVLFAKRYVYHYAQELGLSKHDFRLNNHPQTTETSRNWLEIFESTGFGTELSQKANDSANQIGIILDVKDDHRWQKQLAVVWINKVRENLSQLGVELEWPICKNTIAV
jgi:hypothetical protein